MTTTDQPLCAFAREKPNMKKPRLAITLGDPASIGPEIILTALADSTITSQCEITIIGSRSVLDYTYRHLGNKLANPETLSIIDIPLDFEVIFGQGNAMTGAASFIYLQQAIALTLDGKFDNIVTAPIAKYLWQAAGYDYPGQTEVLAQFAGVDKYGMLFVGRSPHTGWTLRTLLATTHIPLASVAQTLTPDLMTGKLDLLINCLQQDFGIEKPTVAIAGLNPHSGEEGKIGREEQEWLIPWLEEQRRKNPEMNLIGPIPPDTMWVAPGQAWYNPNTTVKAADGYLALYHDQGLIPVKLMAFDYAVNTTIGLPFLRTSPDHGTAFDIAGKGLANATSMKEAIKLAASLIK